MVWPLKEHTFFCIQVLVRLLICAVCIGLSAGSQNGKHNGDDPWSHGVPQERDRLAYTTVWFIRIPSTENNTITFLSKAQIKCVRSFSLGTLDSVTFKCIFFFSFNNPYTTLLYYFSYISIYKICFTCEYFLFSSSGCQNVLAWQTTLPHPFPLTTKQQQWLMIKLQFKC